MATTTTRESRPRELSDMIAFTRRIMRSLGRRVQDRDIEGLAGLVALQADLDDQVRQTVAFLRTPEGGGYSWTDVGRVLGITRQAAQQRYGRQTAHTRP